MEQPRISVVVAAYNIQEYIESCINSLLNQSLKEIEIVVVNDGSTDNTLEILRLYEKNHINIKVIDQKNSGLSSARNNGIKHCNSKLIAFVDGDDTLEKDMYKLLLEEYDKNNSDLVICGFNKVWIKGDHIVKKEMLPDKKLLKGDIFNNYMNKHTEPWVVAWNKLYKKKIILENSITFENKAFFEDVGFNAKYIFRAKKIALVEKPLLNYLQREGSITKTYNPIIKDSMRNTIESINKFTGRQNSNDGLKLRLMIYTLNYHLNFNIIDDEINKDIKNEIYSSTKLPFKHKVVSYLTVINIYSILYRVMRRKK